MRYAFISDIHGNLPALRTVLSDLSTKRVDRIVCLGDTVGYGPQPLECLQLVNRHVYREVLGNHDAVVCGRLDPAVFNDRAQRAIAWTAAHLGDAARKHFASAPLLLRGPNFCCTHGEFTDPASFGYIMDAESAAASLAATREQILFCGHSHRAGLWVVGASGTVHEIAPQDFSAEPGKRYVVNVGSVGSPRDGDPRASYVVYEEETGGVWFHRVPFDFTAFREAVAAAQGLDPADVQLLRNLGEDVATLREDEDFAVGAARVVEGPVEAEVGAALRRSNRRLRKALAVIVPLAVLLAGGFAAFALRTASHHAEWSSPESAAMIAPTAAGIDGNLMPTLYANVGQLVAEPYRTYISDPAHQRAVGNEEHRLVFTSDAREAGDVVFMAPRVQAVPGRRLQIWSCVRPSEEFEGSANLVLQVERANGRSAEVLSKEFTNSRVGISKSEKEVPVELRKFPAKDGWQIAHGTMTASKPVPSDATCLRVSIEGAFRGSLEIGGVAALWVE